MRDSPLLRDAASFAGPWTIEGAGARCRVTLSAERVESANAHALADPEGCLPRLLGRPVAGWRPAPDGIDLAGPDRLSAGFFSFAGEGEAVLARPDGTRLTMRRG